jgi:hypothetical protein
MHLVRGLFAAAVITACATVAANAQGKLEIVGGDTFDWGTVAPGKLTTTVEVKNVGQEELKISDVRPACGCTAAPIDKNLLKPGEIGKINITLDVTGRSGPIEKTVSITSTDSSQAVRVLRLKATVKRALDYAPSQSFIVSDAKKGVEIAAPAIRITNKSEGPITLFAPELSQGNVKIRFDMKDKKELKPGEEFELKAYVTPLEEKAIFGTIKMKTSSTESPTVDFPIYGTMAQPASTAKPAPSTPHQHQH